MASASTNLEVGPKRNQAIFDGPHGLVTSLHPFAARRYNVGRPNVFVSFDLDHDQDLCDRLEEQATQGGLGFDVTGRSERRRFRVAEYASVRHAIRSADQVIVLCGEHTSASAEVFAEVRIAQEEHKPYLLVWGRRERMCTKPECAGPNEGMYGWTRPILREQVVLASRKVAAEAKAAELRRPTRS